MKGLQQPAPLSFSSSSSLSDMLLRYGIPTETWGVAPGSKTLENLWIEICDGDSVLYLVPCDNIDGGSSSMIRRDVKVAIVNIKNAGGATLIESHQLLSDGNTRQRNRPLSEKMKPGESIEDTAARGVREELGEGVKLSRVLMDTYNVKIDDEKSSFSYPGLPAHYEIHSVDAFLQPVDIIPQQGDFSTDENGEGSADAKPAVFVRKHFWKWVDNHQYPLPNQS